MNWKLILWLIAYIYISYSLIQLSALVIIFYSKNKFFQRPRRWLWWLCKKIIIKKLSKSDSSSLLTFPTIIALEFSTEPKEVFINQGYSAMVEYLTNLMTKNIKSLRGKRQGNPEDKFPNSYLDFDEHDFIDEWEKKEQSQNPKLN